MRRQSKYKHRVTQQMLEQIQARYELSCLIERAAQAYEEAYAKARAEREGQA